MGVKARRSWVKDSFKDGRDGSLQTNSSRVLWEIGEITGSSTAVEVTLEPGKEVAGPVFQQAKPPDPHEVRGAAWVPSAQHHSTTLPQHHTQGGSSGS